MFYVFVIFDVCYDSFSFFIILQIGGSDINKYTKNIFLWSIIGLLSIYFLKFHFVKKIGLCFDKN